MKLICDLLLHSCYFVIWVTKIHEQAIPYFNLILFIQHARDKLQKYSCIGFHIWSIKTVNFHEH